jgi:hypothetical protein
MASTPMTQDGLADHLQWMAELVRSGQSFEGCIQWERPPVGAPKWAYAKVLGVVRIGDGATVRVHLVSEDARRDI